MKKIILIGLLLLSSTVFGLDRVYDCKVGDDGVYRCEWVD